VSIPIQVHIQGVVDLTRPLLAQLHLKSISDVSSKADMEDRVSMLKTNVVDEYDHSISRIRANSAFMNLAFRTFTWLLNAQRPLSPAELCQALGIGLHDESFRQDRSPALKSVLESCLGLVKINRPLNSVEFCHYSVKEYFINRNKPQEMTIVDVPLSCLKFLRFRDFSSLCLDAQSLQNRVDKYPLANYFSAHWASHVRGDREAELSHEINALLGSTNILSSLQLLPDNNRNGRLIGTTSDMMTVADFVSSKERAFFLCAYFSFITVIGKAFEKDFSAGFCVSWGQNYSPAHVAVCYGEEALLRNILTYKNSNNMQDKWGLTPMHLAVRVQSSEEASLVQALLESKPNLELADQDGDTALHIAVSYASKKSIELLLEAGAAVNAQDKRGKTPLHRAVENAQLGVTELLLSYSADPSIADMDGKSSLMRCLMKPNSVFLRLLLEAKPSNGLDYEVDPVEREAAEGFIQLKADELQAEKEYQEYLERERKEEEERRRTKYCQTTISELAWAAEKGEYDRLRPLILGGAKVNGKEPVSGKTPLHLAIENRRADAVFWLADAGADVSIKDLSGRTPLDYINGDRNLEWQLFYGGAISPAPSGPWCKSVIEPFGLVSGEGHKRARSRLHRGLASSPSKLFRQI
jgi:ankyrin repeat protein